jgi:hypothetical protein
VQERRDGDADIFIGGSSNQAARMLCFKDGRYTNWATIFGIPPDMGRTGAVWFDYDNDQQLDLYSPGDSARNCLMRGRSLGEVHGLQRVPPGQVIPPADKEVRYVHAVDADMDGWTDLFMVKAGTAGCALYRNEQARGWTDVTRQVELDPAFAVTACAWADFDNDGDMDLAVARGSQGLSLYRNHTVTHHEYVALNLVSNGTAGALPGCTAWMQFGAAKAVGSTHPHTASLGGDGSSLLLVNSSNYKSGRGNLLIHWPNGMECLYPVSAERLNTTLTLTQPTAPPVVQPLTEDRPTVPVQLSVSPNPFNPTTTLFYTLPEASDVELKVFNLMGQEVATLVSGRQAAGAYRIFFDARSLPSGLYLSRLTAAGQSHVGRLLLAK